MCLIVVALDATPRYPLFVAANRDEQHARPAGSRRALGQDTGGSWLALERSGRFAAVTNIREAKRPVGLRSRGALVADFVAYHAPAAVHAARAVRDGGAFGAFNLFLYDGRELMFASNRAAAAQLGTGLHSFSNAPAGVEWPKTASARAGVERLLSQATPLEPLFELLAERNEFGPPEQRYQRTHFVVGPV